MTGEDTRMNRSMIKVNGLSLFYRDTVVGDQAILCLHGRWGRGETWADFISRYKDMYRIIAPDQRGHGLSDKPIERYAGEDLAADAYELIKQLDCGPIIAVGHSMGGRIAAYLTALFPQAVKALAILDETAEGNESSEYLSPDKIPPKDDLTAEWPTPYATYEDALQDLKKRFPRETNVRYFLESLVETTEGYDFLFSRYAMSALAVHSRKWFHLLPQIKCPVLLVRAAESWCLSKEDAEKMRGMIRDCTYYEVGNSDHMVYADNPQEFYPQFDSFLSRV
jgi:pimeloyl-ACP methyl ester carboxylesterase